MHISIPLEAPIEIINITSINPLISKCQIKVCYVSDEPNRNKSIINKETATEMAETLPGSPIVGFFNEKTEDFDSHNRIIDISNGKFEVKDMTRPYGFVDLGAKVWFQKFMDDGIEHEYLMTEGYLWTKQYPECQVIIDEGRNQSMELDEDSLDATWTKDNNGKPQFFIINEAIISKLCILGEDVEPCFEGASISNVQFSFGDDFKQQLFSMMNEIKELINKGGVKDVFTTYAVEIGDSLWSALWRYINKKYPGEDEWCSMYGIEGIYEEAGQKFVILQDRVSMKYYRLNFSLSETEGFIAEEELIEVTKTYTPAEAPQFSQEAIDIFAAEFKKTEDKTGTKNKSENEDNLEDEDDDDKDEDVCPDCGKPLTECVCKDKKKKYNLEDVEEYVDLQSKYSALEADYEALKAVNETLTAEIQPLKDFKLSAEREAKDTMIKRFYMLSDEDKKDVLENIDTYSLEDIEAKLSVICVRNKVSFNLEDDNSSKDETTFNLSGVDEDESTPPWVKAAIAVEKSMK